MAVGSSDVAEGASLEPATGAPRTVKVLVTDWDLGNEEPVRRILEPAGFEVVFEHCDEAGAVVEAARGADALLVRYAPITRAVLEEIDSLRFIGRMGIGPWSVDLDAAMDLKVAVADCPEYCTDEAIAHTVALILALNRRLGSASEALRNGLWRAYGAGAPVLSTSDLTLGIIGLGRVGRGVATAANALGMEVIAYDPYLLGEPDDVEMVDLETVLSESDIVTLLCPDTPETRQMIDAAALARMKSTAYLVNTARGELIDERALVAALNQGQLAGAALDVLAEEPPQPGHPLLGRDDVLVTPHVGYYSEQSQHELKVYAARLVAHYFTGERVGSLLTPDFRRV